MDHESSDEVRATSDSARRVPKAASIGIGIGIGIAVIAVVLVAASFGFFYVMEKAYAPDESGEVELTVVGQLNRGDYRILNRAVGITDGTEYSSVVLLSLDGWNGEPTIPVIRVRLGADGPECISRQDEGWYQNHDYGTGYAVVALRCSPYVELSEFRSVGEIVVRD